MTYVTDSNTERFVCLSTLRLAQPRLLVIWHWPLIFLLCSETVSCGGAFQLLRNVCDGRNHIFCALTGGWYTRKQPLSYIGLPLLGLWLVFHFSLSQAFVFQRLCLVLWMGWEYMKNFATFARFVMDIKKNVYDALAQRMCLNARFEWTSISDASTTYLSLLLCLFG